MNASLLYFSISSSLLTHPVFTPMPLFLLPPLLSVSPSLLQLLYRVVNVRGVTGSAKLPLKPWELEIRRWRRKIPPQGLFSHTIKNPMIFLFFAQVLRFNSLLLIFFLIFQQCTENLLTSCHPTSMFTSNIVSPSILPLFIILLLLWSYQDAHVL